MDSRSYAHTQRTYEERFGPGSAPSKSTIKRMYDKFLEYGTVQDAARGGRPRVLTENVLTDVLAAVTDNPGTSIRRLSNQSGLSVGTVQTVVRSRLGLYPYKISVVPELDPNDPEQRKKYCQWFLTMVPLNGDGLDDWYFSDEAWFHLDGYVNSQNSRIWASVNPHVFSERSLHAQKIGVWCVMSRKRIFLTFFHENVSAEVYTQMLEQFVATLSQDELDRAWFQQDGAPAHTARTTLLYLERTFSGKVISKGVWPPRSPDLTPLDFYLWGFMKNQAYMNHPQSIPQLQEEIRRCVANITPVTLDNVFTNLINRTCLCEIENGGRFEHLL